MSTPPPPHSSDRSSTTISYSTIQCCQLVCMWVHMLDEKGHFYGSFYYEFTTYIWSQGLLFKGCTFQELGKQSTSSANFQAEHLLSRLIFDSSTFCSACKIVRTQSLFTELLKSAAFRCQTLYTICKKGRKLQQWLHEKFVK